MKRVLALFTLSTLAIALASCGSLGQAVANAVLGGSVPSSSYEDAKVAEFRSNEILASEGDYEMIESYYRVATVQQAASSATKDQAQVLFLDGNKAWSKYVIESRKAVKGDIKIGAFVLFPPGWSGYTSMDADSYRKNTWQIGRVTNDDELFKDMVEVNGESYGIAILRTPTSPIKE